MHRFATSALTFLAALAASSVQAQPIVLDSEITAYMQKLATPLQPYLSGSQNAVFLLVADENLNAFVDGRGYVHLHSGLFMKAKDGAEVQGVIAHELGHIASQHLTRMQMNMKQATASALAGTILGIGTAMAGAPQVGTAIAMGGQAAGISGLLKYSRTHEQEADQRAIAALHQAGLSANGMVGLFGTLRTDTQLSYDTPPPYLLTHPLPAERLTTLENAVQNESANLLKERGPDAEFTRIQAKVAALTFPPPHVLRRYTGNTFADRYARTIALARQGNLPIASEMLTKLMAENPKDPWLTELQAQIFVEGGKLTAAEPLYAKLTSQFPADPLMRFQYAETLRNLGKNDQALPNLLNITRNWPDWSSPWRSLGLVYGQNGKLAASHLALTQAELAYGDVKAARSQLALAQHYLKEQPDPENKNWAENLASQLKSLPNDQR